MGKLTTKFENMRHRQKEWIRNLKGIHGYSTSFNISARIGYHYCKVCNGLLIVHKKSVIVNSESEEAKNYNFNIADNNTIGNVKFTRDIYYCPKCISEIEIEDQRRYEGEQKELLKARKKGRA